MKTNKNFEYKLTINLVLVTKYRKQLLIKYGDEIKESLMEKASKDELFNITHIEVNKDNVQMTIDFYPTESVSNIVRKLKNYSVLHIWNRHEDDLKRQFWKNKMFWSKSYFVCSVGDYSIEAVQKYIESQGIREKYYRHE